MGTRWMAMIREGLRSVGRTCLGRASDSARYTPGMFRLTREVRFAINSGPDDQIGSPPTNGYAGYPSLTGLGYFFAVRITLAGELDRRSSYLLNIKQIDEAVRQVGVPFVTHAIRVKEFGGGAKLVQRLFEELRYHWPEHVHLHDLRFMLSPFLSLEVHASEFPMVRLSQRFEFAASHRLHVPTMSAEENRRTFGKCNNPHGHGHNYELQVTLRGVPRPSGVLMDVPEMEQIVAENVVDRFDHKNLNVELPEFKDVVPSVENIAKVIYGILEPKFEEAGATLASVTVWETPKTWCEYSGD
jgi:6-pyruvoyltetrahydropterin/6-carboxytetrahydropterin synthase